MGHTLFTYRDLKELRKIQEEREVFAFIFGETKDMLDSCSDVCVDISALVHFLLSNKNNIETTYINFTSIAEDTVVITEAAIAESAMELLPLLFSDYECYFGANDEEDSTPEETHEFKPYPRQKIYKYNNAQDLDRIIRFISGFALAWRISAELNQYEKERSFSRYTAKRSGALSMSGKEETK